MVFTGGAGVFHDQVAALLGRQQDPVRKTGDNTQTRPLELLLPDDVFGGRDANSALLDIGFFL